jgi:hypothetical protein
MNLLKWMCNIHLITRFSDFDRYNICILEKNIHISTNVLIKWFFFFFFVLNIIHSKVDMLFYGLSTLLKFSSLVQLRFTEPDVFRPYQVPLGNITLLSNLISIFLCFIYSLFKWKTWEWVCWAWLDLFQLMAFNNIAFGQT